MFIYFTQALKKLDGNSPIDLLLLYCLVLALYLVWSHLTAFRYLQSVC